MTLLSVHFKCNSRWKLAGARLQRLGYGLHSPRFEFRLVNIFFSTPKFPQRFWGPPSGQYVPLLVAAKLRMSGAIPLLHNIPSWREKRRLFPLSLATDTCRVPKACGERWGAKFYPRDSQPSGSLCCGRRWHFRKSALSTDKFKLKVISRS